MAKSAGRVSVTNKQKKKRKHTFIKPLTRLKILIRLPHHTMLLIPTQLLDPLLREGHNEHIDRYACHRVVLCLEIGVSAFDGGLGGFAFAGCEFGGVGEGF